MFLRKYGLPLSVFIVAICAVGLYYLQTQPPKEPIVIYKPADPLPKSEVKAPVEETSQGGHVHADGTWHEGSHEAHAPPAEARRVAAETSKHSETEVSEPEKVFGDYTKAELLDIRDWGRDFKAKLHKNYPDILEIPSLTPEEFNARYPTEADRNELKARQREMRDFYFDEFKAFMKVVPAEIRVSAIKGMRAEVAKNWGEAVADDFVDNLLQVTE